MQIRRIPPWRSIATPAALAVVSLVAAVILWIAVTHAENPQQRADFPGGIEVTAVNVPPGFAVASISPASVQLTISAVPDRLTELTAADFNAQVDLSGVRESTTDQVVLAHVVGNVDAAIVQSKPAFVTVTLEPSATKQVPVVANLVGQLPQGVGLDAVTPDPAVVQVTGPASVVQLITSAVADVNVTGLRNNLDQTLTLVARDDRGSTFRGVFLDPSSVAVKVTVKSQEITTPLPVSATIQGSVADGYNVAFVSVDPETVTGAGSLEVLQSITSVTTDPVDINGQKADVEHSVRLRVPSGVDLSRESVTVHVHIEPAQGEIEQLIVPQVTDVPNGLTATLQTVSMTVHLTGEVPTLQGLAVGAVEAKVSAAGLDAGSHVLTPTFTLPDDVTLVDSEPQQVVVILK